MKSVNMYDETNSVASTRERGKERHCLRALRVFLHFHFGVSIMLYIEHCACG